MWLFNEHVERRTTNDERRTNEQQTSSTRVFPQNEECFPHNMRLSPDLRVLINNIFQLFGINREIQEKRGETGKSLKSTPENVRQKTNCFQYTTTPVTSSTKYILLRHRCQPMVTPRFTRLLGAAEKSVLRSSKRPRAAQRPIGGDLLWPFRFCWLSSASKKQPHLLLFPTR